LVVEKVMGKEDNGSEILDPSNIVVRERRTMRVPID
jgi:hypothetical protein